MGKGDGSFFPPLTYNLGPYAVDVVAGFFNGDNALDLAVAVAQADYVSILLGVGNGLFNHIGNFASNAFPFRLSVADFNEDGIRDIAVANNKQSGSASILLGNGDGSFQAPLSFRAGRFPTGVAAADLNNDGHMDVAIANQTSKTVSVLHGKGDGTFLPKQDYPAGPLYPRAIDIADFNRDGLQDIVVTNALSVASSILLANPDGTYQLPQTYFSYANPLAVTAADLNGDQCPDLAIANAGDLTGCVGVLLNDANWERSSGGEDMPNPVAALVTAPNKLKPIPDSTRYRQPERPRPLAFSQWLDATTLNERDHESTKFAGSNALATNSQPVETEETENLMADLTVI